MFFFFYHHIHPKMCFYNLQLKIVFSKFSFKKKEKTLTQSLQFCFYHASAFFGVIFLIKAAKLKTYKKKFQHISVCCERKKKGIESYSNETCVGDVSLPATKSHAWNVECVRAHHSCTTRGKRRENESKASAPE